MSALLALTQRFGVLTGILGGLLLAAIILVILSLGYHLHHRQQVFPGVHFAEVDLQGLSQSEVDSLVQARVGCLRGRPPHTLRPGEGVAPDGRSTRDAH